MTGDTVGDHLQRTTGVALNIVMLAWFAARALVLENIAPAPAVSYAASALAVCAAPSLVVVCIALALYAASAPVVEHITPVSAESCVALALHQKHLSVLQRPRLATPLWGSLKDL